MTMPYVGSLIREPSTGRTFRLLKTDQRRVALMPIGEMRWPIEEPLTAFQAKLGGQYLVLSLEQPTPKRSTHFATNASEASLEHGDRTAERFRMAFKSLDSLLNADDRRKLYKEMKAVDSKLSTSTFYKTLRRWLEGGMTPHSLRARWNLTKRRVQLPTEPLEERVAVEMVRQQSLNLMRAGHPEQLAVDHRADGRPRARACPRAPTAYRVNAATVQVFETYYRKKLGRLGIPLRDLHEEMHATVFSTPQLSGAPHKWPAWAVPSFKQFEYYWTRLHNYKERKKATHGTKTFETNYRGKDGASVSLAYAAGRIGELDATVWNVELVGKGQGAPLLGPPVVFRIRCKDTGMLLGLSVSLENASWEGAALAIANCYEDKTAFTRRIGLGELGKGWPVSGLPAQIDADQGETYNNKPKRFIRLTGCALNNMPGGRGDMKPGVESDFQTLQLQMSHKTPGALIKNYEKEHGIKWAKKASLTLEDFTKLLVLAELERMQKPRKGFRLTAEMIADGVNSSPLSVFEWSIRRGGGGLKTVDPVATTLSLLPTAKASVTEHGLEFEKRYFECDFLSRQQAYAKARSSRTSKVTIAYDPSLVDAIWLLVGDEKSPHGYHQCPLNMDMPEQRDLLNRCWREVKALADQSTRNNDAVSSETQGWLAQYQAERERITRLAVQRVQDSRAEAKPKSYTQLYDERSSQREAEKNRLAPQQALTSRLEQPAEPEASREAVVVPLVRPPTTALKQSHRPSRFKALAEQALKSQLAVSPNADSTHD